MSTASDRNPAPRSPLFAGAAEDSPSRAQYFSWINNTNEGATAEQTAANLRFFTWLHDEYGMVLDIYAFDAGAIDGANGYGDTRSEQFRRQFPGGFAPLARLAKECGARLGLWCGPDGFGETPADERRRHEMMVGLCRDLGFELFKMDAVCGALRPGKQDAFVRMMAECRRYSPDLILLNHRLNLGKGLPHATTFLWEGVETYVDVHIANRACATHNRACALTRGNVPELKRLTEDHGVCLSSCLDYWEDELVIQAFGRSLILAPELYGNPWLLRDDEYPRLARIFNLHRRWRDILVRGMLLPEGRFGPHAVSRGDASTRLLVLRNPTWATRTFDVPLDATIGLGGRGPYEVRRLHPRERVLAPDARRGASFNVDVAPFRSCLLVVSDKPIGEVGVEGCDAEVVRDVAGRPVSIKLFAPPGTSQRVRLHAGGRKFGAATLDGRKLASLLTGKPTKVDFPGQRLTQPCHRKLGDLKPIDVPTDAEALYEATCFAADNNALEVRELERSGPTRVPAVQDARDAFFGQPLFRKRHLWDRGLFDDDPETALAVNRRWRDVRVRGGSFRIDLGQPMTFDQLVLACGDEYHLQPLKWHETVWGSVSNDLRAWRRVPFYITDNLTARIPDDQPWRYVRIDRSPDLVREVRAFRRGAPLDRTGWRASNLFAPVTTWSHPWPTHAHAASFTLPEAPPGSYLAIAIHGNYGHELASVAVRVDGQSYRGAPRRSPSFPCNSWEVAPVPVDGNSTWYVPVTPDLVGKRLDAVALFFKGATLDDVRCEAWITAYPEPAAVRELLLAP